MHAIAAQVEISKIEAKVDKVTGKKVPVGFLKPGENGICQIKVTTFLVVDWKTHLFGEVRVHAGARQVHAQRRREVSHAFTLGLSAMGRSWGSNLPRPCTRSRRTSSPRRRRRARTKLKRSRLMRRKSDHIKYQLVWPLFNVVLWAISSCSSCFPCRWTRCICPLFLSSTLRVRRGFRLTVRFASASADVRISLWQKWV